VRRACSVALLALATVLLVFAAYTGLRERPAGAAPAFAEPAEIDSEGGVLHATLVVSHHDAEVAEQRFVATLYNDALVGPTLRVRPGDVIELTLVNELDEPTNLHFHGLHVSPSGDADNVFREVAAGESARYVVKIPDDHEPGTFWYHSHQHHLSYGQVLGGLSGLILVEGMDDLLPPEMKGIEERIVALKDFEVSSDPETATVRTVNGQVNPALTIAPGETQLWHLANIGSELFYEVALPGSVFHVIAEDGYPVWQTWDAEKLVLPSGKRYDVLVQGGDSGSTPLKSLPYFQGCVVCPELTLATLLSSGETGVALPLPTSLVPRSDLGAVNVDRERTLTFSSNDEAGTYFINDRLFNPGRVDQTVRLGSVEEWTLRNEDPDEHPFHIHVNDFEVISVNGNPYDAHGRQDTVILPGNGEVVIRIPFDDFPGKFVYHCHIMFHGDGGMMGVVEVVEVVE
jgi:suppressor of ftsI